MVARAAALAEAAHRERPQHGDDGPLTPAAAHAIANAAIDGTQVKLAGALPRAVYSEVADAFARVGGRWISAGRSRDGVPAGYHRFPPESVALVRAIAESGRLPLRNPTAFFPSPPEVVERLMAAADVAAANECAFRFLEPHAGQGAIADRIRSDHPACALDVVEVLELNQRVLRAKGYRPIAADFLDFDPGPIYDRIICNPPFSLPGSPRAYQQHIRHAWELLSDRGVLVAVTPAEVPSDRASQEYRAWLAEHATVETLPDGAFKASGTNVRTALVCLDRRSAGWKSRQWMGWVSWHAWQTALWADNAHELCGKEQHIHRRLLAGEFTGAGGEAALSQLIRNFYEDAAVHVNRSPTPAGVHLDETDHAALRDHLLANQDEFAAWAEPREAERAA